MTDAVNDSCAGDYDFEPTLDVSALPQIVKNRVKALKKLQFETVEAEEAYYKEIHALDLKYQTQYDEINSRRHKIITGEHEPKGAEIEWASDEEEEEDTKDEGDVSKAVKKMTLKDYTETTEGIPKFWYHVLRNANDEVLMGMISPDDETALQNLTNLTVSIEAPTNTGFTLSFHFSPNDFFSNSVLTKEYTLRPGHDKECPLEYDGPEIFKSKGCKIDWKEGKDLTQKTVQVKSFKKVKGAKKKVEETEELKVDSFFNFFNPPALPEDPEESMTDEDRADLSLDFDIGYSIKEKIIPRAVLYFTGEMMEHEDDEDGEFEDVTTSEDEMD